ncbi:hypothetical protein ACIU4M_00875 [Bacillus altitudinis]|uniref:hypothetical protein n=1 Tax=Bacillus altitudinis TaxID=293387 RepID=UPI0038998AB8
MGFKVMRDLIRLREKEKKPIKVGTPSEKLGLDYIVGAGPATYMGGQFKVRTVSKIGKACYHALVDDLNESCRLFLYWSSQQAQCVRLELSIHDWELVTDYKTELELSADGKWVVWLVKPS